MRDFPRKKRGSENNKSNIKQSNFLGYVLLAECEFDIEDILDGLTAEWNMNIGADKITRDESENTFVINMGNMNLSITYIASPVTGEEVEKYAAANYMWPEATSAVKEHKAHVVIEVSGVTDTIKAGKLFVKVVSAALNDNNAIAVYTDGVVFEPEFYRSFALDIQDEQLPIINWVWFGIYKDEQKMGMYTYGMQKFGKADIECYIDLEHEVDLNDVRDFLITITEYVLESDIEFADGETIGFTEEQQLSITKDEGIALPYETLKIEYPLD